MAEISGRQSAGVAREWHDDAFRAVDGTTMFHLYAGPQEWERIRALGRDLENTNPCGRFLQGMVKPVATSVMRTSLKLQVLRPELQAVQASYKAGPQNQEQEIMKLSMSTG